MIFRWFVWFSLLKQNPSKIIEKSSKNAWKKQRKQRKHAKILDFHCFFKQNDYFVMIVWWFPRFCLIFSFEAKPSKIIEISSKRSSKNHQKTIVLLEKTRNLAKILDFHVFSSKTIIVRWFFDDFSMIFAGFASKEKMKQNLGYHQKIIKKLSFCLKKPKKTCQNRGFALFFQAKRWFFDDFLRFVWFSLLKQNLQKSSKNYHFLSLFFSFG